MSNTITMKTRNNGQRVIFAIDDTVRALAKQGGLWTAHNVTDALYVTYGIEVDERAVRKYLLQQSRRAEKNKVVYVHNEVFFTFKQH